MPTAFVPEEATPPPDVVTTGPTEDPGDDLLISLPGAGPIWDIWGTITLLQDAGPANAKAQINSSAANIANLGMNNTSAYVDNTIDVQDGRNDVDVTFAFNATVTMIDGVCTTVDTAAVYDDAGQRSYARWNDPAVPTTFRIHSTVAGKLGAGSQIWARARI